MRGNQKRSGKQILAQCYRMYMYCPNYTSFNSVLPTYTFIIDNNISHSN